MMNIQAPITTTTVIDNTSKNGHININKVHILKV